MQSEPTASVDVRFPDHKKALVEGMWNLVQEKRGADLKITCSGHSIKAHHVIMALFVPALRDSLKTYTSSREWRKNSSLDLGYIGNHEDDLELLMEFIYLGKVTVPVRQLASLQRTADALGVGVFAAAVEDLLRASEKQMPEAVPILSSNQNAGGSRDSQTDDASGVETLSAPVDDLEWASDDQAVVEETLLFDAISGLSSDTNVCMSRRKQKLTPRMVDDLPDSEGGGGGDPEVSVDDLDVSTTSLPEEQDTTISALWNPTLIITDKCFYDHNHNSEVTAAADITVSFVSSAVEQADDVAEVCISTAGTTSTPQSEIPLPGVFRKAKEPSPKLTWRTRQRARIVGRSAGPCKSNKFSHELGERSKTAHKLQRQVVAANNEVVSTNEYKKIWRRTQPLLKCSQCNYETRDKVTFKSHTAKHDPKKMEFKCKICYKSFRTKKGFNMHKKSHSGKTDCFRCPYCECIFSQRGSLSRHVTGTHKMDGKGQPVDKNHQCSECSFSCQYNFQLKLHVMRKHSSERPFKCLQCPHRCILKADLKKHVSIVHLRNRNYMCDFCGFRSTHKGALNRHIRSHSKEKPYICGTCGKCYADSHKLKNHLQRHLTDEKPFACHLCEHSCRRKDNLQMHMKRIHKMPLNVQNP